MDKKQITIIIIILSVLFVVIFGGLLGVYFINPSLIGLAPKNLLAKDTVKKAVVSKIIKDKIPVNPSIVISMERALEIDNIEKQRYLLDSVNKDIKQKFAILQDSINLLTTNKRKVTDTISKVNLKYQNVVKENQRVIDSLDKILSNYNSDKQRLALLENRVKSQEEFISKHQDSLEAKNFADFAKMYNSVAPADVARILEQIDERDAARILKLMQSRKASKVLEAMPSEKSAAILLLGAVK
ncbi:MAG TPA: hypothetical protein PLE30_08065 [Candidatus Kapabacteria bacterium]|nr:hypothetical protein [Candidatus Kapabacteria bacterium]